MRAQTSIKAPKISGSWGSTCRIDLSPCNCIRSMAARMSIVRILLIAQPVHVATDLYFNREALSWLFHCGQTGWSLDKFSGFCPVHQTGEGEGGRDTPL